MKKIEYLIYTKEVEPSMVVQQFKKDNIKCILALDVRSAVYYATGISAQCGEIVAVSNKVVAVVCRRFKTNDEAVLV